jgi:polysaccharide export outer membrane protein
MTCERFSGSLAALLVAATALSVTGCSTLPASGPSDSAIESGAAASAKPENGIVGFNYALVDVSKGILSHVSVDSQSLGKTFGLGRAPAPEIRIGVGDVVAVTIFESATGGLFIPNDAGSRPGNFVTLPNQTVDRSGAIAVPYAGLVPALGRSLNQIQADIEKRLASRAIEPQAVVTLVTQKSNDVSVVGDVNVPGKFSVQPGGERVLDLIARAQGLKKQPYESSITVQRDGKRATVAFNALVTNPMENIFVGNGDTIYVYGETKSFVAFGATGTNQKFDFSSENISLAEAVGLAGGLLDSRADPGQTFVYRVEDRRSLEKMGVDVTRFAGMTDVPTIYRTNLRDPSAYFAARSFRMRDKDIIYVSNASSVELIKFLTVVNAVSATNANVPADGVTARDSWHQLGRAAHNQ